ncbi:temptin-like isoform X4 [Mytilus californianus]|uniref:temptin-like isoform X4 n=1 Tax=Mytilus californianus TaxID=6549 RepID=UPI002245CC1E|nr:temptin-like isoform X4 [Mytilus californianus]
MFRGTVYLALVAVVFGFPWFRNDIPNGNKVPDPCNGQTDQIWRGVGHDKEPGGGARNQFGLDFKTAGFKWTKELCQTDSDQDGRTNGQELGDPDCTWIKGGTPSGAASGHPGICEPLSDSKCVTVNKDIKCPSNTGK